ncbi:MAG: hypothetical protein JSU83_14270 [Deltaproteobacteria bacterium]|nr:MAG: hypothetical protein JSU83_14270 [Deltaproteobacteria bacterium]
MVSIENMMKKITTVTIAFMFAFGVADSAIAQTGAGDDQGVTVTVKGESWDADSRGFAYFGALSKTEGEKISARRGSRISLDGRPEIYAIAGPGPGFELTFTTREPSFRLIVDGDRFPRVITQPYKIPDGGGVIDIGRIDAPRAEGPEHTWPLEMAANELGYTTTWEMLADNKAAIRLFVSGSGEEGAPERANDSTVSVTGGDSTPAAPTSNPTNSPFLLRIVQAAYVFPFDMNKKDTFFLMTGPSAGSFLIVIAFAAGEDPDKDVTIQITDTVTEEMLDPPRPWIYEPLTVSVRNGFATSTVKVHPKID